jgi:hypothetical protein
MIRSLSDVKMKSEDQDCEDRASCISWKSVREVLKWSARAKERVTQRERQSVRQAIEADWLTRARDFKCAEPSKTQPPSYVPVTLMTGSKKPKC